MPVPTPGVAAAARVDEVPGPTPGVARVRDRRPRGAKARPRDDQHGVVPARAAGNRAAPRVASVRRVVPPDRVLGGLALGVLARATTGREPPRPIAMHQPVYAPRGPVEMVAPDQGDGQSRDGTTAMDVGAPRRDATHPDAIPERHPSQMVSVPGGTTRRDRRPEETQRTDHVVRGPEPAEPVAHDRVAATGCRHDASRHRAVPRRSAPPR